jgi:SAM-dependent methyltransferase
MDSWKYYAIGHAHHVVCNPLSEAKLDEIIELLALSQRARILDIGCGKGEFLVRSAVRWECQAVGVDLSPHFVSDARARVQSAGLHAFVDIVEGDGSEYRAEPSSFDAAACFGASWIWGGFRGTLIALRAWTKPGGLVISGEPFWRRSPSPGYLKASGLSESTFSSHAGNVAIGSEVGLRLMHAIVSSHDDWDRYEGYQWYAAERYGARVPDDPDLPEIRRRMREDQDNYLQWGRDELGWAVYLFRNEGEQTSVSESGGGVQ